MKTTGIIAAIFLASSLASAGTTQVGNTSITLPLTPSYDETAFLDVNGQYVTTEDQMSILQETLRQHLKNEKLTSKTSLNKWEPVEDVLRVVFGQASMDNVRFNNKGNITSNVSIDSQNNLNIKVTINNTDTFVLPGLYQGPQIIYKVIDKNTLELNVKPMNKRFVSLANEYRNASMGFAAYTREDVIQNQEAIRAALEVYNKTQKYSSDLVEPSITPSAIVQTFENRAANTPLVEELAAAGFALEELGEKLNITPNVKISDSDKKRMQEKTMADQEMRQLLQDHYKEIYRLMKK